MASTLLDVVTGKSGTPKVIVDHQLGATVVNYTVINTATTTVVKTGPGAFFGIAVTAGGVGSTATAYDNTAASGTVLMPATATTAVGPLTTGIPVSLGAKFNNGLTIVTTATSPTILVFWI